ncbi:hypothetical protein R3P38DRAFT_2904177 [Favolaschia claudopus]|uniref:Uncharacterized protein n=1 Tax=Favolaschia claudopus TaxID=2862362 RepID=A0AAW0CJG5_9AGAR
MARTPKRSTKRQSARSTRPSGSVSFNLKNDDDFDPVQDEDMPEDEDIAMEDGSEDSAEMLNRFLTEYKKRESKKITARATAFQNQKKALYSSARQGAKELARDGIACLEEGRAKILALKEQEIKADKFSTEIVPLWHGLEDSVRILLAKYPAGIEDLFPRRSNTINAASEMLRANPGNRADALAECVEAADAQLHQSKQDEINAADASRLIKHYKNLLLS